MSYPTWLLWLAGTLLPLGALWLLWQLALRFERCYTFNRAVLLLAPLVAACWPLLPHPALPAWLAGAPACAYSHQPLVETLKFCFEICLRGMHDISSKLCTLLREYVEKMCAEFCGISARSV